MPLSNPATALPTVEDEGTPLTQRSTINFAGAGVSAADSGGKTVVTIAGAAFVGARVYHDANQAITTGTPTALAFNSERFDTDAFHDTATNNSRHTIPAGKAGKYEIGACIEWASGGSVGLRQAAIRINGTTTVDICSFSGNGTIRISLSTIYDLAAADYAEVVVYQESGGNLNVLVAGNFSPEFWIARLG